MEVTPILSEFSFLRFKITRLNDAAIRELSVDDINNLNNLIPCIGIKIPTEDKLLMMPDGETCHEDYLIFEPYQQYNRVSQKKGELTEENVQLLPENIIQEQKLDLLAAEWANKKYDNTPSVYPAYFGFVEGYNRRVSEEISVDNP